METPPTKTRRAVAALLLALGVASAGRAYADAAPRWSDAHLVGFSDLIARGRVTAIGVTRDPRIGTPYTLVSLDVAEVLRGAVPDRRVVLKQLGGQIGPSALHIAGQPTFAVGEEVIVFLETRPRDLTLTTTAQWQGKFTIVRNAAGASFARRQDPQLVDRGIFGDDMRSLPAWLDEIRRASREAPTTTGAAAIEVIPSEVERATPVSDIRRAAATAAIWRAAAGVRASVRVDTTATRQPMLADGAKGRCDARLTSGRKPASCASTPAGYSRPGVSLRTIPMAASPSAWTHVAS